MSLYRLSHMWRTASVAVLLAGMLAGCSWDGNHSAARSSDSQGAAGFPATIPAAWVRPVGRWEDSLRAAAHQSRYSCPTPPLKTLETRLSAASYQFGFRVIALQVVRAPQGAPLVILQPRSSPSSFAPMVGRIEKLLNPLHDAPKDWQSTAYEGFFIGAQDSHGRPFLYGYNLLRARSGGQWARTPNLYPFAHG